MSGENEEDVICAIEMGGYKLGEDFERQYPIGDAIVIDIAFINEKLAIEVDGREHRYKKQQKKDKQRDRFLIENKWAVLRIEDGLFRGNPSLYRHLIKETVEERRNVYNKGGYLYENDTELPEFVD